MLRITSSPFLLRQWKCRKKVYLVFLMQPKKLSNCDCEHWNKWMYRRDFSQEVGVKLVNIGFLPPPPHVHIGTGVYLDEFE